MFDRAELITRIGLKAVLLDGKSKDYTDKVEAIFVKHQLSLNPIIAKIAVAAATLDAAPTSDLLLGLRDKSAAQIETELTAMGASSAEAKALADDLVILQNQEDIVTKLLTKFTTDVIPSDKIVDQLGDPNAITQLNTLLDAKRATTPDILVTNFESYIKTGTAIDAPIQTAITTNNHLLKALNSLREDYLISKMISDLKSEAKKNDNLVEMKIDELGQALIRTQLRELLTTTYTPTAATTLEQASLALFKDVRSTIFDDKPAITPLNLAAIAAKNELKDKLNELRTLQRQEKAIDNQIATTLAHLQTLVKPLKDIKEISTPDRQKEIKILLRKYFNTTKKPDGDVEIGKWLAEIIMGTVPLSVIRVPGMSTALTTLNSNYKLKVAEEKVEIAKTRTAITVTLADEIKSTTPPVKFDKELKAVGKTAAELKAEGITTDTLTKARSEIAALGLNSKIQAFKTQIADYSDAAEQKALLASLQIEEDKITALETAFTTLETTIQAAIDALLTPAEVMTRELAVLIPALNTKYSYEEKAPPNTLTLFGTKLESELKTAGNAINTGAQLLAAHNDLKTAKKLSTELTKLFDPRLDTKDKVRLAFDASPLKSKGLAGPQLEQFLQAIADINPSLKINAELAAKKAIDKLKSEANTLKSSLYKNYAGGVTLLDGLALGEATGDPDATAINKAIRHLVTLPLPAKFNNPNGVDLYDFLKSLFDPKLTADKIIEELNTLANITPTNKPLPPELQPLADKIGLLNKNELDATNKKTLAELRVTLKKQLADLDVALAAEDAEIKKSELILAGLAGDPRHKPLSDKIAEAKAKFALAETAITAAKKEIHDKVLDPAILTLNPSYKGHQIKLTEADNAIKTASAKSKEAAAVINTSLSADSLTPPNLTAEVRKQKVADHLLESYRALQYLKESAKSIAVPAGDLDEAINNVTVYKASIQNMLTTHAVISASGTDLRPWLQRMDVEFDRLKTELEDAKKAPALTHMQYFSKGFEVIKTGAKFDAWKQSMNRGKTPLAIVSTLLTGSTSTDRLAYLEPKVEVRDTSGDETYRCHAGEPSVATSSGTKSKSTITFYEHEFKQGSTSHYEIGVLDLPKQFSPRQLFSDFLINEKIGSTAGYDIAKIEKAIDALPPGLDEKTVVRFLASNLPSPLWTENNSKVAKEFMKYMDDKSTMTVDALKDESGNSYISPFSKNITIPHTTILAQARILINTIVANNKIPFHFDTIHNKQFSIAIDCVIHQMGLTNLPGKPGISLSEESPKASEWQKKAVAASDLRVTEKDGKPQNIRGFFPDVQSVEIKKTIAREAKQLEEAQKNITRRP